MEKAFSQRITENTIKCKCEAAQLLVACWAVAATDSFVTAPLEMRTRWT